jgi:hypothetical protein
LRVQQVLPPDGDAESWTVVDERFAVVEPADAFLAHLTAIERSPGTVRAYAFDLRDYFQFSRLMRSTGEQCVWNIWVDSSVGCVSHRRRGLRR